MPYFLLKDKNCHPLPPGDLSRKHHLCTQVGSTHVTQVPPTRSLNVIQRCSTATLWHCKALAMPGSRLSTNCWEKWWISIFRYFQRFSQGFNSLRYFKEYLVHLLQRNIRKNKGRGQSKEECHLCKYVATLQIGVIPYGICSSPHPYPACSPWPAVPALEYWMLKLFFFYLLLKKMWHLLDVQSFLLVEFLSDVSGVITSNYHPFVKNFKHLFSFLSIFSCDLCIFCCLDFSPIPTQTTSRSHQHMHRNQTLRRAISAPGCFATEAAYRYKMLRPWKEFLGC